MPWARFAGIVSLRLLCTDQRPSAWQFPKSRPIIMSLSRLGDRPLSFKQHTIKVAILVHIVIGGRLMEDASVVPDYHVAPAPFVSIHVFRLSCMVEQFAK